jgi:hypothetical protein
MKHLLHGAALVALFAVFAPTWAQAPGNAPSTTPPPTSSGKAPPSGAAHSAQAPAASDKATAAASANAGNWVQPRPRRHTRRIRRYGYAYYGYPYYGYYRWGVAERPRRQSAERPAALWRRLGLGRRALQPDALFALRLLIQPNRHSRV